MSVKINQKSWRLKKDYTVLKTNLVEFNLLFFFLRKFLGVFLNLFSLFFLELDTFFFKNKLILNIFVFERQRLLKKKYSPLENKNIFMSRENRQALEAKKNKPALKNKKFQLSNKYRNKNSKFNYKNKNNKFNKNKKVQVLQYKKKQKKLFKVKVFDLDSKIQYRRSSCVLFLRKKQLQLLIVKFKLNTLLKKYFPKQRFQINIISVNNIFLRNTYLLRVKNLLLARFSRFITQKKYKYFCAKWFYLLPLAVYFNYSNLFALCIKDGLERTGRQHSQFLYFFKSIIKFLLLYGFGLRGLRIQIVGKLNGNDRVQRSLLLFGKFPSRTTLNIPVNYVTATAFTYTGSFGIRILHLFNNSNNSLHV